MLCHLHSYDPSRALKATLDLLAGAHPPAVKSAALGILVVLCEGAPPQAQAVFPQVFKLVPALWKPGDTPLRCSLLEALPRYPQTLRHPHPYLSPHTCPLAET